MHWDRESEHQHRNSPLIQVRRCQRFPFFLCRDWSKSEILHQVLFAALTWRKVSLTPGTAKRKAWSKSEILHQVLFAALTWRKGLTLAPGSAHRKGEPGVRVRIFRQVLFATLTWQKVSLGEVSPFLQAPWRKKESLE